MNKDMLKNALTLCLITIIAGFLLGVVYEITKEPRETQKEIAKNNSYKEVMKDAKEFKEIEVDKKELLKALEKFELTEKNVVVDSCIEAYSEDKALIGYVVTVTSKEGYGGNITISVGIDLSLNVTGVSILSIAETAGLGMNAKEPAFLNQYKQEGEGLYVVNKGENEEGLNIDAISGATITTKAMTKAVNAAKITANYLFSLREENGGIVNE